MKIEHERSFVDALDPLFADPPATVVIYVDTDGVLADHRPRLRGETKRHTGDPPFLWVWKALYGLLVDLNDRGFDIELHVRSKRSYVGSQIDLAVWLEETTMTNADCSDMPFMEEFRTRFPRLKRISVQTAESSTLKYDILAHRQSQNRIFLVIENEPEELYHMSLQLAEAYFGGELVKFRHPVKGILLSFDIENPILDRFDLHGKTGPRPDLPRGQVLCGPPFRNGEHPAHPDIELHLWSYEDPNVAPIQFTIVDLTPPA